MINKTFLEKNKTNFISNGGTKSASCLSAVYALMVDWQLGVRMARPGPFYTRSSCIQLSCAVQFFEDLIGCFAPRDFPS